MGRALAELEALPERTYKAVGTAGAQHVEGDSTLSVEVHPPLVVLLREYEVERVPGAPLLRRLHQMLELHPLVSGLRCPWLRRWICISLAVAAMMLKTQKTADRTAASAASTTTSPPSALSAWPGDERNAAAGAQSLPRSGVHPLSKPHSSLPPRVMKSAQSAVCMRTQEDAGKTR